MFFSSVSPNAIGLSNDMLYGPSYLMRLGTMAAAGWGREGAGGEAVHCSPETGAGNRQACQAQPVGCGREKICDDDVINFFKVFFIFSFFCFSVSHDNQTQKRDYLDTLGIFSYFLVFALNGARVGRPIEAPMKG
jgi:hypothetical protein